MAKVYLHFLIFLSLTVCITSCNGQIKKVNETKGIETISFSGSHSKIIKTQGSDKFNQVRCALQDKKGNLWFGCSGEGIYCYNGKTFKQFTKNDGLADNRVWSIMEDKENNIWIGTEKGLCKFNGTSFTSIPIKMNNPSFGLNSTNTRISNPNENSAVHAMLQDKTGKIWICTMDGVFCYDGKSFSSFLADKNLSNKENLLLKGICYILQDQIGNVWFGAGIWDGDGLCKYDGKNIISFKPNGDKWIRYIVEDKNGTIWFGTRRNGNWTFNGKAFSQFNATKEPIGAPLLTDKNGTIWFSGEEHQNGFSGTKGVWLFDGKGFKNYNTSNGLGDYGVWTGLEDKDGNIWLGTRNVGLYKFNGKTFESFAE